MGLFHSVRRLASQVEAHKNGRMALSPHWQAVLSLGLFLQISGILLIADGSSYSTQVHFFLLLPSLVLPPLEFCFGVNPSQAPNWEPFLNCLKSPTVATTADAVMAPTPLSSAAR